MRRSAARLVALLTPGVALSVIAALAGDLGLDPAFGWGPRRTALLLMGVMLTFLGGLYWRHTDAFRKLIGRLSLGLRGRLPGGSVARTRNGAPPSGVGPNLRILPIALAVVFVYAWFASSGTLTTWESPTRYFADLARGFAAGHLHLPTKEPQFDYSQHEGRYYLYFGPVPSILLLLLRPVIPGRVGDLQLTFFFVAGTFAAQCALALRLWQRYFRHLPFGLLLAGILAMGLASPATFILGNHVGGRVYEAAISGGQFFMLSGLLAAISAIETPKPAVRVALAACLWALAIGTRINLALPIGFMTLMTARWMVVQQRSTGRSHGTLLLLALPLALGLGGLGWYNWARFGSALETGYNYTVNTGLPVGRDFEDAFGSVFVVHNLWNYLLTQPDLSPVFPFLIARRASTTPMFGWYELPAHYAAQTLTGLLYAAPFAVFAFAPLLRQRRRPDTPDDRDSSDGEARGSLRWLCLTLGGAVLAASGVLLTYYWVAERFLGDVMPTLMLLSNLAFWEGYARFANGGIRRKLYAGLGMAAVAISIGASTLIAISVNNARLGILEQISNAR